jgi:hypothetical protein
MTARPDLAWMAARSAGAFLTHFLGHGTESEGKQQKESHD